MRLQVCPVFYWKQECLVLQAVAARCRALYEHMVARNLVQNLLGVEYCQIQQMPCAGQSVMHPGLGLLQLTFWGVLGAGAVYLLHIVNELHQQEQAQQVYADIAQQCEQAASAPDAECARASVESTLCSSSVPCK